MDDQNEQTEDETSNDNGLEVSTTIEYEVDPPE